MSIGTPILKEVHGRSAPSGFAGQVSRTLKRCLDCALAALLLVLLLPIFFILGVLVLLDDGWPIFHKRWVVGQNGEFDAFKFRSMRRNADQILERDPALKAEFEQNFKLRDDPRLTRTGEFLRKHSLDELPQLLNVLAGQMSLVGPRPELPHYVAEYTVEQRRALRARPGITDPASLAYRLEEETLADKSDPEQYYRTQILPDKLARNMGYLQKITLRNDIRIIVKTISSSFFFR